MAISWDVQITNVNLQSKRATVTATRTDDASAFPSRVYTLENTPLDTAAERQQVLNTIKEWETAAEEKNTQVATFLATLEQTAKSSLEAWEVTR